MLNFHVAIITHCYSYNGIYSTIAKLTNVYTVGRTDLLNINQYYKQMHFECMLRHTNIHKLKTNERLLSHNDIHSTPPPMQD